MSVVPLGSGTLDASRFGAKAATLAAVVEVDGAAGIVRRVAARVGVAR